MKQPDKTLQFLGATGTVTGSRYLIESGGKRILVDCGMFQGYKTLRERNREGFAVPPDTIDTVLLTHAHLDHSGYLPALVRDGFRGNILASLGTAELCSLILPDSAHLLEEEAAHAKKHKYSKHEHPKPIYTAEDADRALTQFRTVKFDENITVSDGITATFSHAGHILGASQLHIDIHGTSIHFTGDLGRQDDALMNPPAPYEGSDVLVAESTYGDRSHPEIDGEAELAGPLRRVLDRGGVVVIPAFAVGRTQSLLLHISRLMKSGAIPHVPVYVNSPMAMNASGMYRSHQEEHRIANDEFDLMYEFATMVSSVEESIALNERREPMIIISASGMMTGGRVLHHVKAFGTSPKNAILLSGYQAGGTRGSLLASGAETLRIFGEDVPIRAEVIQLDSLSSHADADQMLDWMRTAPKPPRITYITHGEPLSSDRLRFRVQDELKWNVKVPRDGQTVDLDR